MSLPVPEGGAIDSAARIIDSGVVGAIFVFILVPLGLYTRHLGNLLKEANTNWAEAEEARADDAKQVVDKLIQLNDKWNQTLSDQTQVVAALDSTLRDNKNTLQDVRDLMLEQKQRRT